jgi:nucleotide-binding universal stress UspA family protein
MSTSQAPSSQLDIPWRAPFQRTIVATDSSRAGDGAIRLAADLAARDGATVTAVSVVEPAPYPMPVTDLSLPPAALPEVESAALTARRDDVLEQYRQLGLPLPADLVVSCSVPLSGILFQAAQRHAELVIMGLGRHATVDRLFGSETALHAVRESDLPVLAVPATARGLPAHAVVGTDFDASSVVAARAAARLVGPNGRLTLVHVDAVADPLPAMLADWPPHVLDRLNDAFARQLVQIDLPATMQVDTIPLSGPVGGELVACADRLGADVLVVGRHQRSLVERMVLGSVATRVVRTASCAVMVVPREGAVHPG